MSQRHQDVDEYGFPIPPTFESLEARPRLSAGQQKLIRRVLSGVVILGVIVMAFGKPLRDYAYRSLATFYGQRAYERYLEDDLPGALEAIDAALSYRPEAEGLLDLRARFRLDHNDLEGALADYNKLIELSPDYADGYRGRGNVYLRLGRHRDAIDDCTKAINLLPKRDHLARNDRAYYRALAKIELEEGLVDIENAMKWGGTEIPAYLDTRAYLKYLLGQHSEALADIETAIAKTELERRSLMAQEFAMGTRGWALRMRQQNENLAVMYHHRGLIHEKLGNDEQAQADLRRGDELGYDPEKGVF